MKIGKGENLVANLHDKTEYFMHIRNVKPVLYYGLVFKKVHRVIKFNQNDWLKPSVDMDNDLRKKAKHDFEDDFCKLVNNAVFGKTMENVRKHRDIKLVTTHRRRNYFSVRTKLSYYKVFHRKFISNRNEKKTKKKQKIKR